MDLHKLFTKTCLRQAYLADVIHLSLAKLRVLKITRPSYQSCGNIILSRVALKFVINLMTDLLILDITSSNSSEIPKDRHKLYWKWSSASDGLSYTEWTKDPDFESYQNLYFEFNQEYLFQLQCGTTGADGYGVWGILLCGEKTVGQIMSLSEDRCSELRLVNAKFWSQFINQDLDQVCLQRHFQPATSTWVWSDQQWLEPRDQSLWLYNFQNKKNNNDLKRVIFDLGKVIYGLTSNPSFLVMILLQEVVPKECANVINKYVAEE